MDVALHELHVGQAEALAQLYRENRSHLQKWEPERDDAFLEPGHQRELLAEAQRLRQVGRRWASLIHEGDEYVGFLALNHIVRGALQSCQLGYWVAERHCGRGIASSAVALGLDVAFGTLGLHRVEASVRTDNPGSVRVLQKNGFRRIGLALSHVFLGSSWHDQWLYERHEPGGGQ
ncbi:GNAT family N-acetyltransferase [Actinomadura sp. 6N118]|uniref:GNAT family N-acetyltransferase n=1 Tax=Actinomadura sp. 6N118 TaxID=3375151 RepID=UPI0037874728